MPSRDLQALAVDYDRTLTDETLRPSPRALQALRRLRKAGVRVVIVSGRDMAFLEREVGHVADALVAENGCLVLHGGARRSLAPPGYDARAALATLAIPLDRQEHLVSADVEHEGLLRDALARAGVDAALVRNRDRVMVVPRGVDKAMGVMAAFQALGVDPARAAAAGDGENDVPLLLAVGYAIAVENAVEDLRAIADATTRGFGGDGLAAWIEQEWMPVLQEAAR